MLEYGSYVALALLVIWVALLIPLARGTLKAIPFGAASMFLVLLIPFFWLGPEITELTILKVGSFKTNAEQATKYFDEIKSIRTKIEAEDHAVSAAVASVATLQKQATELKLAIEREQAAHLSRTITPEQQDKIVKRLTPTPVPKGPVIMNVAMLDSTDAKSFAEQISNVLIRSGFTVSPAPQATLAFSAPGAWLVVHDMTHTTAYARAIQDAFKDEAGILLEGFAKPEMVSDANTIMICVSAHPP